MKTKLAILYFYVVPFMKHKQRRKKKKEKRQKQGTKRKQKRKDKKEERKKRRKERDRERETEKEGGPKKAKGERKRNTGNKQKMPFSGGKQGFLLL